MRQVGAYSLFTIPAFLPSTDGRILRLYSTIGDGMLSTYGFLMVAG
jgi:hypothetical protein